MMAEAAQISGFSQDGERQDGTDAGNLLETLKVVVVLQVQGSPLLKLIAQLAESNHLTQHDAEHRNSFRVFLHRDTNRRLSRAIDIFEQALFTDLSPYDRPRLLDEVLHREASDHGGRGEHLKE